MNVNELLINHLRKIIKNDKKIINYAINNSIYYPVANMLGIDIENHFIYKVNMKKYEDTFNELVKIIKVFDESKID